MASGRATRTRGRVGLCAGLIGWQSVFFVGPILLVLAASVGRMENFRLAFGFDLSAWDRFGDAGYLHDGLFRTVGFSLLAALVAVALALPAGFVIVFRLSPRAGVTALVLLTAPFFANYLVRLYAWQVLFADQGLLTSLFGDRAAILGTTTATFVGYLCLTMPVVVVAVVLGLRRVGRDEVDAAANLGASPARAFVSVILPRARPGLVVGGVFAFVLVAGDPVSPAMLGSGNSPMATTLIIDSVKSQSDWPMASVLATLLLAAVAVVALVGLQLSRSPGGTS